MGRFFADWLHNLWVTLAVLIGVGIFMIIFMKIFYPDALGMLFLSGQFAGGLISALKLWPLAILVVIFSAFPRRRPR